MGGVKFTAPLEQIHLYQRDFLMYREKGVHIKFNNFICT